MAEEKVTILAVLVDKFTGPLKAMGNGVKKFGAIVVKTGKIVKGAFSGLTKTFTALRKQIFNLRNFILAGLGAAIIKVFADFEDGLLQVGTLVDETTVKLSDLGDGVRQVGKDSGDTFKSLNKALFDIISAGVEATESIETLGTAARLGVGGGTTTAAAAKGLVGILNAYNLEAAQAVQVSDSLFTAMKGGITTIGRLADNVGKVAPIARTAGLSFDEMNAAIAVLTKSGLGTEEAVTGLKAIINGILNPTEEATQLASKLGIEFDTAALKTKGLADFLTTLTRRTGQSEKVLTALFPNIRAIGSIFALTADDAKGFTDQMEEMGEKAGATQEAFDKASQSLSFQLRTLKNTLFDLFIEVGEVAKPFIVNIIERLRDAIQSIIDKREQLRVVISSIGETLKQVFSAISTLFKTGDIIPFVVNLIRSIIKIAIDTLINGLPLLLRTVTLVGKKLGIAIIQGFLGGTKEELAKSLARGGIGGRAGFGVISNLFGQQSAEELKSIGRQLIQNEEDLAAARAQIAARQGQEPGALPSVLDTFGPKRPGISSLTTEREGLLSQLAGGTGLDKQLAADTEAVKAEAKAFVEAAATGIEEGLRELPLGLTDESGKAIDGIFDLWGEGFKAKLETAKGIDVARNAAEEAARKAAEAGAEVAEEVGAKTAESVSRSTVSIVDVALKETGPMLDKLKEAFRDFLVERDRIEQELASGGLFRSEAGALDAQNLEAFRMEFEKVNTSLDQFVMQAGEAAPVLEALFADTREQMELMNEEVEKSTEINQSFFKGLENGFLGTIEGFADLTEAGVAAGQTIGDALVDGLVETAFDAKKSWSEFVSDFLLQMAKLIAKALVAYAVMAALKAIGGVAGSFNQGGLAFASGGEVPGPSINRDVVNAKLTPGEFVVTKGATDYYGAGVLYALNKMLVPKSTFANLKPPTSNVVNLGSGFQDGGAVQGGSDTPGLSLAVMVPDEQAAERFFAGGRGSFLRLIEDNSDTIKAILGA